MMTAHLLFLAEILGRNSLFLRRRRPEDRPGQRPRRLVDAVARWRRQQAPPADRLSNHLRRDIGLDPVRDRDHWLWHR